jgi:ribosomal protein S18 acetylase RimI-like enzyme
MAVRRLDDQTLALLGHLNLLEFSRTLARWSGVDGKVVEDGGVLLFASGSDFPVLLNGAARLDQGVSAEEMQATADVFFGALGRGYSLTLRDGHADDLDIRTHAEVMGWAVVTSSPEMVVRQPVAERAAPDGVTLRWVDDGAPVADFVTVADAAYASLGMPIGVMRTSFTSVQALSSPEVRTVIAYLDDEPVATAQTLLSHGIAGVYCVATLDAARGRGLGDLVTRAVTNRAFDEGARANTLQASSMGEPIYARMGWEELYRYSTLIRLR